MTHYDNHPLEGATLREAADSSRKPTVIDLFCGSGGLSEGLSQAGFQPVAGVDFDRNAASTFVKNHPGVEVIVDDIANVSGKRLLAAAQTTEIDLIAGGPSCQGFSTHGKRMQDDPRNYLFKHFVRIVEEIQPKMFLMENVRGMLTYGKGAFRRQIENAFAEAGYRTEFTKVLAADYGVPQLRNRVLFLGTRSPDIELKFPEATHGEAGSGLLPYVSASQAIGDLPRIFNTSDRAARQYATAPQSRFQEYCRTDPNEELTLHTARPLSAQAQSLATYIGQGEGIRSVPSEHLPPRFQKMRTISSGELRKDCTTLYHRLDPERPSYTITCNYRNVASGPFLNPWEDRAFTHREAARFMSFPDSYEFVGTGIPRQIGNAVPPLLAKAVGLEIVKSLRSSASPIEVAA